jgi:hypothetical protein
MVKDLRSMLDGWDYEPGKISVRKIIGIDRREKIQARVDLGLMQFEAAGRPDGQRPHNFESLLQYHEKRLARQLAAGGTDEGFELSPEQCRELRHEAYLYHQRYVALFVLEEFDGVERDSEQTMRLIELCERYGATPQDREALRIYHNYVAMMNTRARAYRAMNGSTFDLALAIVDAGVSSLQHAALNQGDADEDAPAAPEPAGEIELLCELRQEIIQRMPDGALPKLYAELSQAIDAEDYETAARLRDRIATVTQDQDPRAKAS